MLRSDVERRVIRSVSFRSISLPEVGSIAVVSAVNGFVQKKRWVGQTHRLSGEA